MSPSGVDFDFRKSIDLGVHKSVWISPMHLEIYMEYIVKILIITRALIYPLVA